MKLCINCQGENHDDAVFCSACGTTLIGDPTGQEALNLKKQVEPNIEAPTTQRGHTRQPVDKRRAAVFAAGALGVAAMLVWTIGVGVLGFIVVLTAFWVTADAVGDPALQQSAGNTGFAVCIGTVALAMAPWLIAGIILGLLWWRSRKSAVATDVE